MTWADKVEDILREQNDYFHDAGRFTSCQMLRFQVAKALWDLRRKGVLLTRRERYRGVHNGVMRQRSRMIYSVTG